VGASRIRAVSAAEERKRAHIARLLEPGAIQPVYQPIVRLTDLEAIGYEGLARFPYVEGLSHLPPDVTLAAAGELGLRMKLEVSCWAAMAAAGAPPGGRLLFVNISPDALGQPGLLALADQLPSRLVIEITEQHGVDDYVALRRRLEPWVARGVQVAIDDTGAGYASLQHVVELRPDFLKLTRKLVADIDRDANRQALLRALAAFAREVGAVIVAEGVERIEELEVLQEAEVDYAQGWLFGRPGPPWPEVPSLRTKDKARVRESSVGRRDRVERDLAAATTPEAACTAVVDHLRSAGLMPSVYVEQGGRLRCLAAYGYWTVYDGMSPRAGVIGRTFRSGETTVIPDVTQVPEYMSLVSTVRAEIAVPIRIGTRVVGVLNIEATTPLGDGPRREIERSAGMLARRLGELGPLDRPSAGQRLSRAAIRAAATEDPDSVIREAALAARDVAGMESVAVVLSDRTGVPAVVHATGPFDQTFADMSSKDLASMASWVAEGTSMRTMGDLAGRGPKCLDGLRRAGAGALVIVPLAIACEQLGFIAIADRSSVLLDTETTEMVELLGVQAASQLRGLTAVAELRERAARDPLTGLGHHATFHASLPERRATAASAGRQLALVLADLDGFKALNDKRGHAAGDEVLRAVAGMFEEVAPQAGSAFRVGGDEFALLVDTDGRSGAQELAWKLQGTARKRTGTTLSIGVALATEGESDAELLERADRALYEVKRRGRDGVALATPKLRTA
jgi:diguanylate cyclase (GGDEF)-like protein